jgi:hypothetical protein
VETIQEKTQMKIQILRLAIKGGAIALTFTFPACEMNLGAATTTVGDWLATHIN